MFNYLAKLHYYKLLGGTFKEGFKRIKFIDDKDNYLKLNHNESIDVRIYAKENNIKEDYAFKLIMRQAILNSDEISEDKKRKFI